LVSKPDPEVADAVKVTFVPSETAVDNAVRVVEVDGSALLPMAVARKAAAASSGRYLCFTTVLSDVVFFV
jgi:hypothetical protein